MMTMKVSTPFVFLMVVMFGTSQCQYCNVVIDTDIVIAVHDSVTTIIQWWGGGIFISPGVTNFLRTFVTLFDFSKVRLSLIAYGSTVRQLAPFTNNPSTLQSALNWQPEFGGARTYDAVTYVTNYFRDNARPNAAKVVIFLTNRASDNFIATTSRSIQMRNDDVAVVGAAFGRSPLQELSVMARDNSNVFYSFSDFQLLQIAPRVKRRICGLVDLYRILLASRVASETVLVLDHSDSTRRFTGLEYNWATSVTDFATQFVESLASTQGRCASGIVTFSDDATVQQSVTTNIDDQRNAIANLAVENTIPFSGSSITSGILSATDALLNNGYPNAQKFMIVVIDGSPIDGAAMTAASDAAVDAGIIVYAVSFRTTSGLSVSQTTLNNIATDAQRILADRTDADLAEVAGSLAVSTCVSIVS